MFEAGALSKSLEQSQVCPILFGVVPADIDGPLNQFQFTAFEKSEVKKLVTMINGRLQEGELAQNLLDSVFEKWWPDLFDQVSSILEKQDSPAKPIRQDRELLEEILLLSRSTNASLQPFIDLDWIQLLHQFAGATRNKCLMMMPGPAIYSTPVLNGNKALPNIILAKNKEYLISLLGTLAALFKLVAPANSNVWVSLRDRRADDSFHTFARAGIYTPNRESSSKPIHKDSVMLVRLKENYQHNGSFVLLTGSERGPQVWERSENDKYGESKSVLLGGILARSWNSDNVCWENNKLVWILGINSDTKNAFANVNPDLIETCLVALSFIANIIARQEVEGRWNSCI